MTYTYAARSKSYYPTSPSSKLHGHKMEQHLDFTMEQHMQSHSQPSKLIVPHKNFPLFASKFITSCFQNDNSEVNSV